MTFEWRRVALTSLLSLFGAACADESPGNVGESQEQLLGRLTLASEDDAPGGIGRIVTDTFNVFWMAQGYGSIALRRVSVWGGTVTTLATRGDEQAMDIVRDESGLYWLTFGMDISKYPSGDFIVANVLAIDPIDGHTTVMARDAGKEVPYAIATDLFDLYWVKAGSIRKLPKRHPGAQPFVVVPPAIDRTLTSIALDLTDVYFTDVGRPSPYTGCAAGEGKIWRVSKNGGEPSAIATGESCPVNARVDAAFVYWLTLAGELRRAPKLGGPVTILARGVSVSQPKPADDLAQDFSHVYFAAQGRAVGTMAVFRMNPLFPLPIELGSTEVDTDQRIHNVSAVDLTSVYYAVGTGADGGGTLSIMRASKLWCCRQESVGRR